MSITCIHWWCKSRNAYTGSQNSLSLSLALSFYEGRQIHRTIQYAKQTQSHLILYVHLCAFISYKILVWINNRFRNLRYYIYQFCFYPRGIHRHLVCCQYKEENKKRNILHSKQYCIPWENRKLQSCDLDFKDNNLFVKMHCYNKI